MWVRFLLQTLTASTLGWFLRFTIAFRVGWPILSDNGSAFCDLGKFRLVHILERKSFKVFATFRSSVIGSSSSIRIIFFWRSNIVGEKSFNCFPKGLIVHYFVYIQWWEIFFFSFFAEVIHTYFFVSEISVWFHYFCLSESWWYLGSNDTKNVKWKIEYDFVNTQSGHWGCLSVKINDCLSPFFSIKNAFFLTSITHNQIDFWVHLCARPAQPLISVIMTWISFLKWFYEWNIVNLWWHRIYCKNCCDQNFETTANNATVQWPFLPTGKQKGREKRKGKKF